MAVPVPLLHRCQRFAADTDCTAVAAAGLRTVGALPAGDLAETARQLELSAAPRPDTLDTRDGEELRRDVFMVYWEDGAEPGAVPRGRKHDAVACANALYAITLAQRAARLAPGPATRASLCYVADHLCTGRYRAGTRYYPDPDAFLYSAARLSGCSITGERLLRTPLIRALSHVEVDGAASALAIAQRILAAHILHVGAHQPDRRRRLLWLQRSDGSWPPCPAFRMGRVPVYFGSAHLTTLFAIAALRTGPAGPP